MWISHSEHWCQLLIPVWRNCQEYTSTTSLLLRYSWIIYHRIHLVSTTAKNSERSYLKEEMFRNLAKMDSMYAHTIPKWIEKRITVSKIYIKEIGTQKGLEELLYFNWVHYGGGKVQKLYSIEQYVYGLMYFTQYCCICQVKLCVGL